MEDTPTPAGGDMSSLRVVDLTSTTDRDQVPRARKPNRDVSATRSEHGTEAFVLRRDEIASSSGPGHFRRSDKVADRQSSIHVSAVVPFEMGTVYKYVEECRN